LTNASAPPNVTTRPAAASISRQQRCSEGHANGLLCGNAESSVLDEAEERFANKQRIRTGFGYRRSFAWRFEILYIWTRSRNTIEEGFSTADNSIDIRLTRLF
jgi:hypothetical protein